MHAVLKGILRPFARAGIAGMEMISGFKTDPTGYLPYRWAMVTGGYESFLVSRILERLPDGGTFVDVGANVGYISKAVYKAKPDLSMLIAVEPNPRIYPILRKNLPTGVEHIQVLNMGFAEKAGQLSFYHGKNSVVGTFVKNYGEKHGFSASMRGMNEDVVAVNPGSKILNDIDHIDVMKIDVEGFEINVIEGLREHFTKRRIGACFFEYNRLAQNQSGNQPDALFQRILELGYQIHGVEAPFENVAITPANFSTFFEHLGERGYTTLVATPRSD